jgi:hypothetical protein
MAICRSAARGVAAACGRPPPGQRRHFGLVDAAVANANDNSLTTHTPLPQLGALEKLGHVRERAFGNVRIAVYARRRLKGRNGGVVPDVQDVGLGP